MDHLLFVEGNTSGTGSEFIRRTRALGWLPVVLTADLSRYRPEDLAGACIIPADTSTPEAVAKHCLTFASDHFVRGVWSSSEYYMEHVALAARKLGLPGPNFAGIRRCRNKYLQCQRLLERGVQVPAFRLVNSPGDAAIAATQLGLPVVAKPPKGSGSIGVRLCTTVAEVCEHAEALLAVSRNERGLPIPQSVLIETFLDGPEYSVETFGRQVIGITKKHLGSPPNFIETGHDFPAALPEAAARAASETALAALKALGLGWGPAHTEIRLSHQGPAIIEVNPRLAGGNIPALVKLATGVDLIQSTLQLVAGEAPTLCSNIRRFASIRFVVASESGSLAVSPGYLPDLPGLVEFRIYREPLEIPVLHGDFRDRVGHVIVIGSSPHETADAADNACSQITLLRRSADVN